MPLIHIWKTLQRLLWISLLLILQSCPKPAYADVRDTTLISLDFVDSPIQDVARSVSLAYDIPILVDGNAENRITFHLDGVGLFEGLSALCSASNLDIVQEGKIFHIRERKKRGTSSISFQDSLVSFSLQDKDVGEFIQEYGLNTGLNVSAAPAVKGVLTGSIQGLPPEKAFRLFMESKGFRVGRRDDLLVVEMTEAKENSQRTMEVFVDDSLLTVNLEGVLLSDFLRNLSSQMNLNLALYGELQEKLWLKFEKVKLCPLLESVFKGSRYAYTLDSTGLYVAERGAKNALSSSKLYPLKHVHSEKVLPQLGKLLPGGNFVASEVKEQNAILLGGSVAEIVAAESLLAQIDVPALQVTLSCIIVEIKRGKGFEIGLHTGSTRKTGEYDLGVRGFYDFLGKDVSRSGAFGKIGILPDRFEVELASLEENNRAEVLARPKLTTLNGNKAELNVTNTVYYLVSQVSADGYPITDYRSFNDGISLELTPSVTQVGRITLEVSPEIKTAGRSSGDGPRDISTRNLKTTVVLKNGETLCLGGLIRKNTSEVRSGIPFLGSIPLLGRIFSYTSEEEEESELAIFITPEVTP